MVGFRARIGALFVFASAAILIFAIQGCGGRHTLESPQLYGGQAEEYTAEDSDSTSVENHEPATKEQPLTYSGSRKPVDPAEARPEQDSPAEDSRRFAGEKSTEGGKPDSAADRDKKNLADILGDLADQIAVFYGGVDNADSASAIDDDIWRLFDLAEEYHAMGVIANREASWEEAQYYFERCLKILASLDVDEADTTLSPEAAKYSTILDNVIADYRVTLLSLGRLEQDAAPSVIVERFGDLERRLGLDTIRVFTEKAAAVTYDLPVVMNDRVKKSVIYFQTVARDAFTKYLQRSRKYTGLFREILSEYNLPQDMIYLSLVESGYNPNAYSWARAVGLWQFISSTGRLYGLNRNWWIDERRDPVKSTHAACRFLKDLYERFGDWELAMAAYNGGPGRVSRAIKSQGTTNFWKLRLKRQTMDYVPLIYAAAIISKNLEKYGFDNIEYEDPVTWEEVSVDRCLDLKVVAREIGCSFQELKDLNPEILRNYTPPNAKKYTLKVPLGKRSTFYAAYEGMPSPKETSWVKHKIRRGESVSTIAAKYGVSQYAIFAANNLSRRSKIYAGKNLIVPVPLDRSSSGGGSGKKEYFAENSQYVVRSGDTMWDIARAFGTTVDELRRINYIERGSRIYVGQKLKIPSGAKRLKERSRTKSSDVYAASTNQGESSSKYKVRAGDTLWDIARKFGTTTSRLRSLNGLGRSSRIYPGQILHVAGSGGPDYIIHKVRRGDTLSGIARRYRTSIAKILASNGLTDPDELQAGARLKIYTR
jgi:membrane-bound lytic murein transglycosylase D